MKALAVGVKVSSLSHTPILLHDCKEDVVVEAQLMRSSLTSMRMSN